MSFQSTYPISRSVAFLGTLIKAKRAPSSSSTPLILDTYPAPIAYSLEYLSTSFVGNPVVTVRRSSDNSTGTFTPSQITSTDDTAGNLLNFTPDAFTGSGCKFTDFTRILFTANDSVDLRVTGDLTIIGHLKLDTYTNSAQAIVTKYGTAGNRGYQVRINGGGRLAFLWSEDGTNQLSINSAVMPVSGGDEVYFKIDFDVDNGAGGKTITFSLSSDGGQTFTQFDQAVEAGTTQIFPTTAILELMETSRSAGELYRFTIKDGIDGVDVFDADFTSRPALSGEFTENTGKVVTPNFTRCVITDWHNQGTLGASADATQATAAAQPLIYDSVNGLIKGANGKPEIKFDGVDDRLETGVVNISSFGTNAEASIVYDADNTKNFHTVLDDDNGGDNWTSFNSSSYSALFINPRLNAEYPEPAAGRRLLYYRANSAGDYIVRRNGSQVFSTTGRTYDVGNRFMIGSSFFNPVNKHLSGNIQEIIIFDTDQTANQSAIETDINNRYTIY